MAYEIVLTDIARGHYRELDVRWKSSIKQALEAHVRDEPAKVSRNHITRLDDRRLVNTDFAWMTGGFFMI